MHAFLFNAVLTVVLIGVGLPMVRRLDGDKRLFAGERAAMAFLVGAALLYFLVFAVGPFRLDVVSMSAVAAVLVLLSLPGLRTVEWGEGLRAARRWISDLSARPGTAALWLCLAGIAVSGLVQGLAPPNDYDSLLYHLALPKYDLERGYIGVPWGHNLPQAFHPEFTRHFTRFLLALSGDGAAQMFHGVIAIFGALGTGAVARRMGLTEEGAILASIVFLATRMVVWQVATAETDLPSASFVILAMSMYLVWRESGKVGHGVLIGLALGAALLTKLYIFVAAICFALLLIWDVARRPGGFVSAAMAPLVSAGLFLPHAIRTFLLTGNPVYPVLNGVFNPDKPNPLEGIEMGVGHTFPDFLAAPWNISIHATRYFDGMVLGAPFFLAFVPLIFLGRHRFRMLGPIGVFTIVYFAAWFWLLAQHVRYLMPVIPVLSVLTAAGVQAAWQRTEGATAGRLAFAAIFTVVALNQAMFVGIYGVIRLPVAIGLVSPSAYHAKTPGMGGAFYDTCRFISTNLRPGERYLSFLAPHSYYCPQASAILSSFDDDDRWWLNREKPVSLAQDEFIRRLEQANVRYVVVQTSREDRTAGVAQKSEIHSVELGKRLFGAHLVDALQSLTPVFERRYSRVYDGAEVLSALRAR